MTLVLAPADTHVTHEVEVHDDGPLPEGGVVLPGGAGQVLLLPHRGQLRHVLARAEAQLGVEAVRYDYETVLMLLRKMQISGLDIILSVLHKYIEQTMRLAYITKR